MNTGYLISGKACLDFSLVREEQRVYSRLISLFNWNSLLVT